ncbi:galanin peptides-like [Dermochelys coriacea]|uniref:galanin peptides-like n=1 Tax=Dermochelys coriacea TaxID=27794 RepID=UPI001CAA118D|nr:galanin peptides-like [Dermochelys coriacea]
MGTPAVLCISLALWALLGECAGIPLMLKDKRGWTLNSAGYLLGRYAHRPLMDKGVLSGKREATEGPVQLEVEFEGAPLRPAAERSFQTLLDFLSSLCLPGECQGQTLGELGALDRLPLPDAASQP